MKKPLVIGLIAASALAVIAGIVALVLFAPWETKVKVKTGERVVCTYGETISSSVRVVEVPASEAGKYRVTTKTVTCKRHATLEKLYSEAQKAIAAGDVETAKAKLAQIQAIDPTYRKTGTQLADLDAGKTPAPDTSTPATGTPGPGTTPDTPVAGLKEWVPDEISGYTAQPIIADENALTRVYLPTSTFSKISAVTIVAEKQATTEMAAAAAKNLIWSQYSTGRETLKISGRTVYFGTYNDYAAISWSESAVQVTVEARAKSGPASNLKSELQSIAGAIIP